MQGVTGMPSFMLYKPLGTGAFVSSSNLLRNNQLHWLLVLVRTCKYDCALRKWNVGFISDLPSAEAPETLREPVGSGSTDRKFKHKSITALKSSVGNIFPVLPQYYL